MVNEEQKTIKEMLSNKQLYDFIRQNLRQSLPSVGFSEKFAGELTEDLDCINVSTFQNKYSEELGRVFTIGFFQAIVPEYFEQYVIPEIPKSDKFLDIGCGTGILISRLAKTGKFNKLTGIDVLTYPEWKIFSGKNIDFQIVDDKNFPFLLGKLKPDSITLTWTLHHMKIKEQCKYLEIIFSNMKKGSKLVILEDAYSDDLQPENGKDKYEKFMKWNKESRKKIMSIYDWVANRILAQRAEVSIPFTYRTMEEWIQLGEKIGFRCFSKKFIGFPDKRDINTPQSLVVFEK